MSKLSPRILKNGALWAIGVACSTLSDEPPVIAIHICGYRNDVRRLCILVVGFDPLRASIVLSTLIGIISCDIYDRIVHLKSEMMADRSLATNLTKIGTNFATRLRLFALFKHTNATHTFLALVYGLQGCMLKRNHYLACIASNTWNLPIRRGKSFVSICCRPRSMSSSFN